MRRWLGIAIAAASIGSASSSCTVALSYPDVADESGARCDNAIDDDLDALVDCADPSCDGETACNESTRALCADGRDNDADGRRDQEDLGCWRFVRSVVTRCESIGPADFAGSLRGIDGGWSGEGARIVLDPDDPSLDVAYPAAPDARALLRGTAMAGSLDDASISFRLSVGPTSRVLAGFLVDGADLRSGAPDGLFVSIVDGDLGVAGSDLTLTIANLDLTESRWFDVTLRLHRIDDGPEVYEVEVDGTVYRGIDMVHAFPGRDRGRIPGVLVAGRPLRPMWMVEPGASGRDLEGTRLGVSSARLGASHPCGYPVPQIATTVRSLARGSDGMCAITEGRDAVGQQASRPASAWHSRDLGAPFEHAGDLRSSDVLLAAGSSLAYREGAYEGVLALVRRASVSSSIVQLLRIGGATCGALDTTEIDLLVPTNMFGFSPTFLRDSRTDGGAARILMPRGLGNDFTTVASSGITTAVSSTATSDTFVLDDDEDFPPTYYRDAFAGVQILELGNDRAVLLATDRGIEAVIRREPGLWDPADNPMLTPTGALGTFDERLVSSPTLMLDPPARASDPPRQTGLIAFTGAPTCTSGPECDLPTGILEIELVPPSAD